MDIGKTAIIGLWDLSVALTLKQWSRKVLKIGGARGGGGGGLGVAVTKQTQPFHKVHVAIPPMYILLT